MESLDMLLTREILLVAVAIMAVLAVVRKAMPQLRAKGWWRRLLPFAPLVLGVGAALIPGISSEEMGLGECILTGIWSGFLASHCRKLLKQSILGKIKADE